MKDEILLHKNISQGGIQAVDAKTKTDSKVPDDIKTFLKLALVKLI